MSTSTPDTVRCRTCGHAVPVGTTRRPAFCPQCGRPLRAGYRWTSAAVVLLVFVAGTLVLLTRVHSRHVRVTTTAPVDPAVTLAHRACAARVADVAQRTAEVRAARQALVDQVADLSNLSARVTTAARRAADEGRWPAKVAGRSLMPLDAEEVVARFGEVRAEERAAADQDAVVLQRLAVDLNQAQVLAADVERLARESAAGPTAARRAEIDRRAAADQADLPAAPTVTADPMRPVDVDALLR